MNTTPIAQWQALVMNGPDGRLDRAMATARLAVMFYLFTLPFPHSTALKNLGLAVMFGAAIWLWRQRRLNVSVTSPVILALLGLIGVLCVTAAIGTDPLDSFGELRKHFLPGILLMLLIPATLGDYRLVRLLLGVIGAAYVIRAGLALSELAHYLPDLDQGRSAGRYIKGFALDAGFYLPALLGLLLLGGRWRWLAFLGVPMILAAMLLVQSRSPVLAVGLAAVVMLIVLRRWRILLAGALASIIVGAYLTANQPAIAQRMASMFDPATYRTAFDLRNYRTPEDGLTARVAIWHGVAEVTAPRTLQGYGFGWKKLGETAVDRGFVARWEAMEGNALAREKAWYFALPTDKVNPHNLYLQIYFESGWLGLLAYFASLLVLFWQAFRLGWRARGDAAIVSAVVLTYLVDHVILGLTNGLWLGLGPSFALIALLEVVRRSEKSA